MSNIVTVIDFQADLDRPFPIRLRDLYTGLEAQGDFSSWAKDQLERAQLVINVDYILVMEKNDQNRKEKRGGIRKEYYLTLNSAQHVALMSNTKKGAEYRQRFIDLEQAFIKISSAVSGLKDMQIYAKTMEYTQSIMQTHMNICAMLGVPPHLAQIESAKHTKKITGIDMLPLLTISSTQDDIIKEEVMLEPTELGKMLNIGSAIATNRWLKDKGLQIKEGGQWEPTNKAKGMFSKHAWAKGTKSGYNIKWNVECLKELL